MEEQERFLRREGVSEKRAILELQSFVGDSAVAHVDTKGRANTVMLLGIRVK